VFKSTRFRLRIHFAFNNNTSNKVTGYFFFQEWHFQAASFFNQWTAIGKATAVREIDQTWRLTFYGR
jgi:hypothetical protein